MRDLRVSDLLSADFQPSMLPVRRGRRGARVAVVGGRAAAGRGLLPHETLAWQLEQALTLTPGLVDVVPIARPNLNALEALVLLRQLLPQLDLDAVVLVFDDDAPVPWQRSEAWGVAVRQSWLELRDAGFETAAARRVVTELVELLRAAGVELIVAHYDARAAAEGTRHQLRKLCTELSAPFVDLSASLGALPPGQQVVSPAEPSPSAAAHRLAAGVLAEHLRSRLVPRGEDLPAEDYRAWSGRASALGRARATALAQLRRAANEELRTLQLGELLELAWKQLATVGELTRRFERRLLLEHASPTPPGDAGARALAELGRVAREVLLEVDHRLAEPELPRVDVATAADDRVLAELSRAQVATSARITARWPHLEATARAVRVAFAAVIGLAERYDDVPIPFDETTQALLQPLIDVAASFRTALRQTLTGPADDRRAEVVLELELPVLAAGLEVEITLQHTVVQPEARRWLQGTTVRADGPRELRFGLLEGVVGFVETAVFVHDGWGTAAGPRELRCIRRIWLDRGGERTAISEGFFFAVPFPAPSEGSS